MRQTQHFRLILAMALAVTSFTPAMFAQLPSWKGVRNLPVPGKNSQSSSSFSTQDSQPAQSSASSAQNSEAPDPDVPDDTPLAEKRIIAQYKATKWPGLLKQIQDAAGYAVPVQVKWAKIAEVDDGKRFMNDDFATNVYFVPLAKAFGQITKEPIGAKTLKAKVKKVVATFERDWFCSGDPWEQCIKLESGTLTLNFGPYTGEYHPGERAAAIVRFLDKNL